MAAQVDMGLEDITSTAALKAALAELIATLSFVFVGVGSIAAFLTTDRGIIGIATAHGLLAAGIGPISGGRCPECVATNSVSSTD